MKYYLFVDVAAFSFRIQLSLWHHRIDESSQDMQACMGQMQSMRRHAYLSLVMIAAGLGFKVLQCLFTFAR